MHSANPGSLPLAFRVVILHFFNRTEEVYFQFKNSKQKPKCHIVKCFDHFKCFIIEMEIN